MFILKDTNNVVVLKSANDLEYLQADTQEDGLAKWRVSEFMCMLDTELTKVEITSEVPVDFQEYKYCHDIVDGIYPNPQWVEPPKPVEEVVAELETQLNLLTLQKAESELEIDERLTKIELGIV